MKIFIYSKQKKLNNIDSTQRFLYLKRESLPKTFRIPTINPTKYIKKLTTLLVILASIQGYSQKNPINFVPEGYVLFDKYHGDLNKDNVNDCLLIIKGTDKNKIINDGYGGKADRNRRGIILLLKMVTTMK